MIPIIIVIEIGRKIIMPVGGDDSRAVKIKRGKKSRVGDRAKLRISTARAWADVKRRYG